jgi:predicted outer membrane lipoprotein
MLLLLDILLTIVHLAVIVVNLFGWMSTRTRKLHLVTVVLTAASWFILGTWFGWGYCPITDWQWQVKEMRGETDLPNSFIKYYADKLSGNDISSQLVDRVTLVAFAFAVIMAVYYNLINTSWRKRQHQ